MSDSLLVTIEKDAQRIRVHINALEEHLRLGWKEVEAEVEKVAAEVETEVKDVAGDAAKDAQAAAAVVAGRGRRSRGATTDQQA
jgi:hypothetical protein